MDQPPGAQRRRVPDARVARQGLAEQPGRPRARERPRRLRQRQGDGAVGHPAADREPGRRRDPARRERRRHRPAARDGPAPDQARRGCADADGRGDATRRARQELELASQEALSKGITTFEDAGSDALDDRPDEGDGRRGEDRRPTLGDGPAVERDHRAEAGAVQDDRLRQRPPDRPRDQEADRRRAGLARRVAARALLGQARVVRSRDDQGRRDRRDGAARDAERLPAVRARHRRPRQPRDAEHLRARLQGQPRRRRTSAGASSTRSTSARPTSRASASWASSPSMQGIHCTSDAPYVLERLGARARRKGPTSGRS